MPCEQDGWKGTDGHSTRDECGVISSREGDLLEYSQKWNKKNCLTQMLGNLRTCSTVLVPLDRALPPISTMDSAGAEVINGTIINLLVICCTYNSFLPCVNRVLNEWNCWGLERRLSSPLRTLTSQ